MMKQLLVTGLLLAALPVSTPNAAESREDMIRQAESAAPKSISSQATIVGRDGNVLRKGSNGWTCMPNTMPEDNAPMCNDEVWMKLMQAVGSKSGFSTDRVGISYMLQGEGRGGGVSNSDPYHPDPRNADDYVETGPHMMVVLPKAQMREMTSDPLSGGPWVMWKDTPYAHVMVPLSDRKN